MTTPQRFMYIAPIPPPPPPPGMVCERIATNQVGEPGVLSEPLEDFPGSGLWTGATSGETGVHERYEYEIRQDLGFNIWQQYIVMKEVSGSFTQGETLVGTLL